MPPLGLPILPNLPNPAEGARALDDLLKPDERVPLKTLAARVGWPAEEISSGRLPGVVWAESKGDSDAYNNTPCGDGENAVGLLQLCSVHKGKWGSPSDKAGFVRWAKDPVNNLKGGLALWQSEGWGPWEGFTNGAWVNGRNRNPLITVGKNSLLGDPVDAAGDAAGAAADAAQSAARAVTDVIGTLLSPDTWFRIGKGGLGLGMVILGTGALVFVVANKASGSGLGKTAKTAATVVATRKVPGL